MKIVRIEQGKRRNTVKDAGDMEVQKRHGECTSHSLSSPRPHPLVTRRKDF